MSDTAEKILKSLEQSTALSRDSVILAGPAAQMLLSDELDSVEAFLATLDPLTATNELADPAGHRRRAYHLLALHLCLTAYAKRYDQLPSNAWAYCDDWVERIYPMIREAETHATEAVTADEVHLVLWQALCLCDHAKITSRDVDIELVDAIVHRAIGDGKAYESLTPYDPNESPDAWVYRELVGLHALANLALLCRSRVWAQRVEQIAIWHQDNTQPDHVTSEPWGLFGFIWSSKTQMFADQQLHDVVAYGSNAVSGLLLADAANSLAAFG